MNERLTPGWLSDLIHELIEMETYFIQVIFGLTYDAIQIFKFDILPWINKIFHEIFNNHLSRVRVF